MHKYLRAIGFSRYKSRKDVQKLLNMVCQEPDTSFILHEDNDIYGYVSRSFGKNMGIKLVGAYDEDHRFREEYYFPYIESDVESSKIPVTLEKHSDRVAYGGIIDDPSMGISLIFYMNNGIELVDRRKKNPDDKVRAVSLNALCIYGKILMPLYKTETEKEKLKASSKRKDQLLQAARNGDESAMESLAMDDMNIIHNITNRITKEDIYTLVDTCFMPYGLESDQYAVIGEIHQVDQVFNRLTGELCWQLTLECNSLMMTVMINSEDLLGEPEVGRRFKGEVWLQGTARFAEEA